MPNWCTQNLAITGETNELCEFVNIINSLPERKPVEPDCDCGPFWLGNLAEALGRPWRSIPCRGKISDGGGLLGPGELSEGRIPAPDKDGVVYVTFVSAWGPCNEILELIRKKWPSLSIFHKETDEFGNFHTAYDPLHYLMGGRYCAYTDGDSIETDDWDAFFRFAMDAMGKEYDRDAPEDRKITTLADSYLNFLDEGKGYLEIISWDILES